MLSNGAAVAASRTQADSAAASRTQADSAAALERAVLLLGRTIAASSMQAVTPAIVGKQIGASATQTVLALTGPHAMST
jgi:hypothetical protein